MGFFSRSSSSTPTDSQISTAGRQLANGNTDYADQLVEQAGKQGRSVAMRILAASADDLDD